VPVVIMMGMGHHPAPTGDRESKARMRAEARRREAATLLRLIENTAGYAARQLANGLSPAQARLAAIDAAGELEMAAAALRRLARLPARQRAALAALWAGRGMGTHEIAVRLGVSDHTAWHYRNGRRADGQPWA
jgi:hypothetical protein